MPKPCPIRQRSPFPIGPGGAPLLAATVNMGNPHAIFFVDDLDAYDLAVLGPALEHDPLFPERANISLRSGARARSYRRARLGARRGPRPMPAARPPARSWSPRRAGAHRSQCDVSLPGGDLRHRLARSDDHVVMDGPGRIRIRGDPGLDAGSRTRRREAAHAQARASKSSISAAGSTSSKAKPCAAPPSAPGRDDLVIVNTCAVTAEAARQARQTIRRLKREAPERTIIVTGCAAQIEPQHFRRHARGRARARQRGEDCAPRRSGPAWRSASPSAIIFAASAVPPARGAVEDHTRAFLAIQTGCDHRCTFCIIPFGRGASRSTPMEDVLGRCRVCVDAGLSRDRADRRRSHLLWRAI